MKLPHSVVVVVIVVIIAASLNFIWRGIMRAVQVGLRSSEGKHREACVVCVEAHEAMFRDCHMQAICSKECHEEYMEMCQEDKCNMH